tara:strand:+ start:121 stop:318 length:198 start_codon:yes stop_codon:yes gene_type:complete
MINIVEEYFSKNPTIKLSIKKLKRKLNISTSKTYYLAMNSKQVRIVEPLEVGSNKKKIYVFTLDQ